MEAIFMIVALATNFDIDFCNGICFIG